MDQKIIEFNESLQNTKKLPKISVGDIVRVHRKIKEGEKERVQVFKGLVIAIKGKQSSSPTITVRRVSGGIGIEMIFPIFSPVIQKIEILRHSKVRRSKLYYMRERFGKVAKMKTIELNEEELNFNNQEEKAEKEATENKDQPENNTNKKEESSTKKSEVKENKKESK